MTTKKEIEQLLDSLKKVAFYVGHGKYNDHMSLEKVQAIKETLEKILEVEIEYKNSKTKEEIEIIYKRLEKFKTFTIMDFVDYEIEKV